MDDLGATVHHMFQKVSIYDELKIELVWTDFSYFHTNCVGKRSFY